MTLLYGTHCRLSKIHINSRPLTPHWSEVSLDEATQSQEAGIQAVWLSYNEVVSIAFLSLSHYRQRYGVTDR